MKGIIGLLDYIWSIKFIKGYRSIVARAFLVGVSAYQFLATAKPITDIYNLPDIPIEIYAGLAAYFGLKLEQFAAEHKPE